jgi:hypothetical protein
MLSAPWTTITILAGVASSLALFVVIVKAGARKSKKAAKMEKAQIVKQLLALSEQEDTIKGIPHQRADSQSCTPLRHVAAGSTSGSRTSRRA